MNIDKEICMITKTKFQDIREELDRNYYKNDNWSERQTVTYDGKFAALKKAVDELLILLDKAVSQS